MECDWWAELVGGGRGRSLGRRASHDLSASQSSAHIRYGTTILCMPLEQANSIAHYVAMLHAYVMVCATQSEDGANRHFVCLTQRVLANGLGKCDLCIRTYSLFSEVEDSSKDVLQSVSPLTWCAH